MNTNIAAHNFILGIAKTSLLAAFTSLISSTVTVYLNKYNSVKTSGNGRYVVRRHLIYLEIRQYQSIAFAHHYYWEKYLQQRLALANLL